MAAWANEGKLAWIYTADNGVNFRVNLNTYITAQKDDTGAGNVKVGGSAAVGTEPKLGGSGRLRRALVTYRAGNNRRTVYVASRNAPLLTFPLPQADSHTLALNRPSQGDNQNFVYDGLYLTETRNRRAGSAGI